MNDKIRYSYGITIRCTSDFCVTDIFKNIASTLVTNGSVDAIEIIKYLRLLRMRSRFINMPEIFQHLPDARVYCIEEVDCLQGTDL